MTTPAEPEVTISHSMEDYLKAVYQLSSGDGPVSTSQLAERMQCTPASVTNMLQKLSALRLVEYKPYQGVTLTVAGRKVALEVIRHHRLLELYLAEVLGYSWDEVHQEAEKLEHVISEEFEDRIDRALGHPTTDPHGDPIPTKEGKISSERFKALLEIAAGSAVEVKRVSDRDAQMLRYLSSIGIQPGVVLHVVRKDPFNGSLHVSLETGRQTLSEELASRIFVLPASPDHL